MSPETIKALDCERAMNSLESELRAVIEDLQKSMRTLIYSSLVAAVGLIGSAFAYYRSDQAEKYEAIAASSQIATTRITEIEKQQAKIDANLSWLVATCARIEAKQNTPYFASRLPGRVYVDPSFFVQKKAPR